MRRTVTGTRTPPRWLPAAEYVCTRCGIHGRWNTARGGGRRPTYCRDCAPYADTGADTGADHTQETEQERRTR